MIVTVVARPSPRLLSALVLGNRAGPVGIPPSIFTYPTLTTRTGHALTRKCIIAPPGSFLATGLHVTLSQRDDLWFAMRARHDKRTIPRLNSYTYIAATLQSFMRGNNVRLHLPLSAASVNRHPLLVTQNYQKCGRASNHHDTFAIHHPPWRPLDGTYGPIPADTHPPHPLHSGQSR